MNLTEKPKLNVFAISKNLEFRDGIWYSKTKRPISYPIQGNNECFIIEDNSFWFIHRNNILKEVIKKFSFGKLFFDIGGGNGAVTKALINESFEVYLVEPGNDGILNARKRGIGNLINANFEDAMFLNESIDNIGLFDVIEHLESDHVFLKKMWFVISPKGRIFITVPAYSFLWSNADETAGHFRRYTKKSLTELMNESGYKILYSTYFFSFLMPIIFFFKTLPNLVIKRKNENKIETDHFVKQTFVRNILNKLCLIELNIIKSFKKIYFGSSYLIVAEKKTL